MDQFLANLATGRPATDDEHGAVRQVLRTPIARRIELHDGRRNALRKLRDARLLRDALVKKGWRDGQDLTYFEADGAEHSERAWAARIGPMLRFLFGR